MHDFKNIIGIIATILVFVGYAPYIRDIIRGKTKPHIYSWFLWFFVTAIAFGIQVTGGAGIGALVTLSASLMCLTVLVLGIKYKSKIKIVRSDTVFLVLSFIALGLWLIAKQPVLSAILITLVDVFGFALVKLEEQKTLLEAMVSKSNMKLHQVLTLIVSAVSGKYGFAHREWFPLCATEAEVEARAIAMGAFYLESLLKKKAWNDLDGLIVSSSMLPEDLSEKILQFAKHVGILPRESQPVLRDVRLACSSSAAAFVLALTDPKLKDVERVGLISLDPLADYFRAHPGHLCLERLQEIAVFSSGSGAVAFSPKDLELGESTTIIVGPDDTTQFRKFYSFEDTKPLPPELINFFSGDTTSITIQGDDDHMAMLLNMPLPDDDTMGKFGDQRKLMGFIAKSLKTVFERARRNASTTTMNEKILFVTNAASKDMTERFAAQAKTLGYNFETVFYPFGNASGSSLLKHLEMAANAWVNDSETPAAIVLATTAVGNSMSFVELRLKEEQNSRAKNDGTS